MNIVVLTGRITKDAEIRYSQGSEPMAIARFTIAVDRKYKKDGEQGADFISCVAFGKRAEFMEKYGKKGTKFNLEGSIQTGSYTNKDGQKVYTTDVIVNNVEFGESKKSESGPAPATDEDGFMNIPDNMEELPFN
jgi:single-strand DNA-binding protein